MTRSAHEGRSLGEREPHDRVRQDPDTLEERKIGAVTAVGLLVMGIALVVAWLLLERWGKEPPAPAPRVAPSTIGTLEQSLILHTERGVTLRREQAASLKETRWVDRDAGIAQIPIEDAIDLLAAAPPPVDRPMASTAPPPGPAPAAEAPPKPVRTPAPPPAPGPSARPELTPTKEAPR